MPQLTIRPVYKLLRSTSKDYITRGEFNQLYKGSSSALAPYIPILTALKTQLGKFKKLSKEDLIAVTNKILTAQGYGLTRQKHKVLFTNTFWPENEIKESYDQAFYNNAPNAPQYHAHSWDGKKSRFYFRCERNKSTGKLLIGNIQAGSRNHRPLGVKNYQDYKKLMVHATLNYARTQGVATVILHGGSALRIAQGWKKTPAKTAISSRRVQVPPPAPEITQDNYSQWHKHYMNKFFKFSETTKHSADKIMIENHRYRIVSKTSEAITVLPERAYECILDPFHYLCHFTDSAARVYGLAEKYGPGALDPEYQQALAEATAPKVLSRKTYIELENLIRRRAINEIYEKINNIFAALGTPREILETGSKEKLNYLNDINLLDNDINFECIKLANFIQGYLVCFGYCEFLVKKFSWLKKEAGTGYPFQAIGREFQRYSYTHAHSGTPGLTIPLDKISAPVIGETYSSAWDFVDCVDNYPQKSVTVEKTVPNPRYGVHQFYQKELPKIVQQLGYSVRAVKLKSQRASAKVADGWEVDLSGPQLPLVLY